MSYGLAYGLSAYGLAAQLKISTEEAKVQMEQYFARFGGVRDYLHEVVDQARKDGYTSTVFGRRRYLPELDSSNRQVREAAERAALNVPIQGSAADIIKVAMIHVDKAMKDAGLRSRMLLQVHDELLFEVARASATRSKSWSATRWAAPTRWTCRWRCRWVTAAAGTRRRTRGGRGARGLVPGQPLQRGCACPRSHDPIRLLLFKGEHSLVAEAAIDAVANEGQLDHLGGEVLDRFAGGPSAAPGRPSPIARFRSRIEPSQVASFGVTMPAPTMPGSLAATTRCSLRRLATPSAIASQTIGTIHNT